MCDQQEGEVLWIPSHWWHEACSLDDYSVGIHGVIETTDNSVPQPEVCNGASYSVGDITDIAYCQEEGSRCPLVQKHQVRPESETRGDDSDIGPDLRMQT